MFVSPNRAQSTVPSPQHTEPAAAAPADAGPVNPAGQLLRHMATSGLPAGTHPAPAAHPASSAASTPPMDLERATAVLDRDFKQFDTAAQGGPGDDQVSQEDLQAVATSTQVTHEQKDAAQFLLNSPVGRNFLDNAASDHWRLDGVIGRGDVSAAMHTIRADRLPGAVLDTAAEGGLLGWPDGKVRAQDVQAALTDPGVPQQVKDAIHLAQAGSPGADLGFLSGLTSQQAGAAASLLNSPDYAALSGDEQASIALAFRDGKGADNVSSELAQLIAKPDFKSANADVRTDRLQEVVFKQSGTFQHLSAGDQQLVQDAFAGRSSTEARLTSSTETLLAHDAFQRLSPDEKTAVLSQLKNYPDAQVADNFGLLLDKSWFSGSSFLGLFQHGGLGLDDKQRSLKLVGFLTASPGGDTTIRENSLRRFLDPGSTYTLKWENLPPDANNNIVNGYRGANADSNDITLNSYIFDAGNAAVKASQEPLITSTFPHEVSHAVNDDSWAKTYQYLGEEYRAWYVGHQAQHGAPPSNQDALERWAYFLNPVGAYAPASSGALSDPAEAAKIHHAISQLTGMTVIDSASLQAALQLVHAASSWTVTLPTDPAALMPTGDLDN